MESLKKLIPHSIKKAGIGKQVEAASVVSAAEQALLGFFGPDSQRDVRPLYFKNRTLTVSCRSSTFAQEIKLNEAKILEKINDMAGERAVERIRYLL
ncbi:MAG TPA: hypothetical protein DDW36_04475 [Candidatus Magasanikbacteria bacterium]|nr:hypothetical protein [Candidatus Magasanikbacteria bacterium]